MKFKEIKLPQTILSALEKNKYEDLTPVQEAVIPAVQDGLDVLGCSQTGSGKTGAFLIPILSKLIENESKKAIIVAPTRELAMQIMDNVKVFCENDKSINRALLIGGAPIRDQLLSIQRKPKLIVGTPGRINDFLDSGKLKIDDFDILVLDEMDRMLDMGFSIQIDEIIKRLPKVKQTMLFSATISKKIEVITQKYLREPLIVKIGEQNKAATNVSQEIINVKDSEKFSRLLEKLKENTLFTLVFVRTKFGTEKLATKLEKENIMARAIHGDLRQSKRARIIKDFREKKFNVLVATDVAARGLDIHHIDTVINYDLPESPEDYIHRIGRCSRGLEACGTSISFCGENDGDKLRAIKSLMSTGDYEENRSFRKQDKNKKRHKNGNDRNLEKEILSEYKSTEEPKDKEEKRGRFKNLKKIFSIRRGGKFSDRKPSFDRNSDRKSSSDRNSDRKPSFDKNSDRKSSSDRNSDRKPSYGKKFQSDRKFSSDKTGDFSKSSGKKFSSDRKSFSNKPFSKNRKRDGGSGYDIEGLMPNKSFSGKRLGSYFVSNEVSGRRKKKMKALPNTSKKDR